jgi:hypothetical protein
MSRSGSLPQGFQNETRFLIDLAVRDKYSDMAFSRSRPIKSRWREFKKFRELWHQTLGFRLCDTASRVAFELKAMEDTVRRTRYDILAKLDGRVSRIMEYAPAFGYQQLNEGGLVPTLGLAIQPRFDQPLDDGNHLASFAISF